jgi:anaerobic magnesium-protoporphyrin IX monomethyl ester cyclase
MATVVLIAPPRYEKGPDRFMPQNLGLGYLASVLERGGHTVRIIDALALGWNRYERTPIRGVRLHGLSLSEIARLIPPETNFCGITSSFVTSMPVVRALARSLKEVFPSLTVVSGGITPSIDPSVALKEPAIDYVIRGAGETPLVRLVSGEEASLVEGVVSRAFDNGRAGMIAPLDAIPLPARHLLPMETYLKVSGRGRRDVRAVSVLTSRGCPYGCGFCAIHHVYGRAWKARSPENVLKEIMFLVERYRVTHIEFEDDNLTLDEQRARALFEGLTRLSRRITWSTPNGTRVDTLSPDLLKLMKESGCTTLFLSIESGDPEILTRMNKKLDLEKVEEVVSVCGKLNINTSGIFIVGYPGETTESFARTVAYIKRLRGCGLVGVGASVAKAYPGTELRAYCQKEGLLIDPERYDRADAFGEYVDIRIAACDGREILRRLAYIRRNLNPLRMWCDRIGLTGALKFLLPQWLIDLLKKRLYRFFTARSLS